MAESSERLSNPFSTGGGGVNFEVSVQTYFAMHILAETKLPYLADKKAVKMKLQARHAGFNTDDCVIFGENGAKMLCQIKHEITVGDGDETFSDVLTGAWNDYCNLKLFNRETDSIVLVVNSLGKTDIENTLPILEWAKTCESAEEYVTKIYKDNFSSKEKKRKYEVFSNRLKSINKDKAIISDDDVWSFLKHFNIMPLEVDNKNSNVFATAARTMAMSINQEGLEDKLRIIIANYNQTAGTITRDKLLKELHINTISPEGSSGDRGNGKTKRWFGAFESIGFHNNYVTIEQCIEMLDGWNGAEKYSTGVSDNCKEYILRILTEYDRKYDDLEIRRQLVLNFIAFQKFDSESFAEDIYENSDCIYDYDNSQLSDDEWKKTVCCGLQLVLENIREQVSKTGAYSSMIKQCGEILNQVRMFAGKTQINQNERVQYLEKVLNFIGGPKSQGKTDTSESIVSKQRLYADFYKSVVMMVEGEFKSDFLDILGRNNSIVDNYIEPRVEECNGERLTAWVCDVFNDKGCTYDYVHLIKGDSGYGKSTFCLTTVYDFIKKQFLPAHLYPSQHQWSVGLQNVLFFSLSPSWYTDAVGNQLKKINDKSERGCIIDCLCEMIDECNENQIKNSILFLDGYDDLLMSSNGGLETDLIDEIRQRLENKIRGFRELNIQVFITVRGSSLIAGRAVINLDDYEEEKVENDVTIRKLSKVDREEWYKNRINAMSLRSKQRQLLQDYWENHFAKYEKEAELKKDKGIDGIIGSPFLFRVVVNKRIEDLKNAGQAYKELTKKVLSNSKVKVSSTSKEKDSSSPDILVNHEKLAFGKYTQEMENYYIESRSSFEKRDLYSEFSGFFSNCPIRYFVRVDNKNRTIDFSHESFEDYFLASYVVKKIVAIKWERREKDKETIAKEFLSSIARWRFRKSHANSLQMIADLLEEENVDAGTWKIIFEVLLERLSVVNNMEIDDSEHTDDGEHNYCMREYNNIFCNAMSIYSYQKRLDPKELPSNELGLSEINQRRLAYLLKLYDCSEMCLTPVISKIEAKTTENGQMLWDVRRSIFSDSLIKEGKFEGWNLEGSDFRGSDFENIIFSDDTSLVQCNFESASFRNVAFRGAAVLSGAVFNNTTFENVSFGDLKGEEYDERCIVNGAVFNNCTFKNLSFYACEMYHSLFDACTFEDVKFDYVKGIYSSSFRGNCTVYGCSVKYNGRVVDDSFEVFDEEGESNFDLTHSCTLAVGVSGVKCETMADGLKDGRRFIEDVKLYCDKRLNGNQLIDECCDDGKRDCGEVWEEYFGTRLEQDAAYGFDVIKDSDAFIGILHIDKIQNLTKASRDFQKCIGDLKVELEKSNVSDVHVFYKGPVFIPVIIGNLLGSDFNIFSYQYNLNEKTYELSGIIT